MIEYTFRKKKIYVEIQPVDFNSGLTKLDCAIGKYSEIWYLDAFDKITDQLSLRFLGKNLYKLASYYSFTEFAIRPILKKKMI